MSDLELQLDELRQELESLDQSPDAQAIQDLETRAQELLILTSGSSLNDDALALFEEVSALRRQATVGALPPPSVDTERLLRGARVRIRTAGTPTDLQVALDQLRQVLDAEPENAEAYGLLEELAEKNDAFKQDVEELLIFFEHRASRAAETLSRIRRLSSKGTFDSAAIPLFARRISLRSEVKELVSRLTNQHYRGEYLEAIELCHEILLIDPNNAIAEEYLPKAKSHFEEGHVPDTRIPYRARAAYNMGISAKTSGLYKEAQDLFNKAQQIVAESEGIDRWVDVENQLAEIEGLVLAKKLEDEADNLAKQDHWEEAVPKYDGALALKGFPRTLKKYEALNKAIETYRQIGVRLSTLSGSLTGMARQLQDLRSELSEAREYWSESSKLGELWAKVDARSRDIGARLQERGQDLLLQADNVQTIDERLLLIEEALFQLEAARDLPLEDRRVDKLLLQAFTERERTEKARRLIAEAEKILDRHDEFKLELRSEEGIRKASEVLELLPRFVIYLEYQSLLVTLIGQLLGRSVYARDHNDLVKAEAYLVRAEGLFDFIFCISSVSSVVESVEQQHYKAVESLREHLEQQLKEQRRQFKFNYALSLTESRQYDDAIILLEELSIKDSQNQTYPLHIKRAKQSQERDSKLKKGRTHLENSDWERAIEELEVALDLAPTDPEVQKSYAEAVELMQRYTKGWSALTTRQKVNFVARAGAFMLFLVVTVFLIAANVLR